MKVRLRKESETLPTSGSPLWPADAEFEYNAFGEKLMTFPQRVSFIKDVRGAVRRKSECEPFRRDGAGNYYYVHISEINNVESIALLEQSGQMLPSTWKEDWPAGIKPF